MRFHFVAFGDVGDGLAAADDMVDAIDGQDGDFLAGVNDLDITDVVGPGQRLHLEAVLSGDAIQRFAFPDEVLDDGIARAFRDDGIGQIGVMGERRGGVGVTGGAFPTPFQGSAEQRGARAFAEERRRLVGRRADHGGRDNGGRPDRSGDDRCRGDVRRADGFGSHGAGLVAAQREVGEQLSGRGNRGRAPDQPGGGREKDEQRRHEEPEEATTSRFGGLAGIDPGHEGGPLRRRGIQCYCGGAGKARDGAGPPGHVARAGCCPGGPFAQAGRLPRRAVCPGGPFARRQSKHYHRQASQAKALLEMRNPPILALLVGAALLLRLFFVATQATAPVYQERSGDEYRYLKLGYDLISGRSYADIGISNAPLYPLSVGLLLRPFLTSQTAAEVAVLHAAEVLPPETLREAALPIHLIRGWGAVLGAALVWLVYRGARILSGDERVATTAALAVAIGPAFIREASVIGTETLYTTLLVAGIVIAMERPGARGAALSGALIGLATLTRMPPLLLPPALVALWWFQERHRWRAVLGPVLALLLSFVAVLALWALYTALAWGRPILVSDTSIGAVAFRGALGGGGYQEIDEQVQELTGTEASEEGALPYEAAFWEVLRADPLGYLLGRAEALLGAALQPHGTLYFSGPSLKALLADWWRDGRSLSGLTEITRASGFGGKALLWAFHLVALAGGTVGIWRLWRVFASAKTQQYPAETAANRERNLGAFGVVLLALFYTYGLHFWLDANARYLFPNEPLWWLLAGVGLVWLGEQVRGWWRGERGGGV